jgi:cell division protein FtsN
MARTAKKQAPAKIEEDDDTEGWEDAVVETEGKDGGADLRLRDWRDVERFREMKDLRRLVDDDYGLEEIFHVHLKPRIEVPPRQPKAAVPARLTPAPKVAAKPAPKSEPKPAPKAAAKAPKPAAKPAKAKPKAKAKRK